MFGLKRKEVEAALDRIADSYAETWAQRAAMEERNHELAVELSRHQEAEAMLRKTLVTAERSADVLRADARRDAERIVREAEQRARELVGESHHERERIRHEIIRLEEREREFRARFRAMIQATASLVEEYDRERPLRPAPPAASAPSASATG